ncbi:MAG: hypothetical protein J0L79_03560 [Rickettsiales bacterium]|nr:hypothetical protein [Rickettsiales bacterium]MCA0254336.1 hypothetical protein [Pseudomonadota bacterium]
MAKTKNIAGCRALKKANELIGTDLDNAISFYNQAVASFKDARNDGEAVEEANLKNAYINLSIAQAKKDNFDGAIALLTEAMDEVKDNSDIIVALFNHRFNKASKALVDTDYGTIILELEEAKKLDVAPRSKIEAQFYITHAKVKSGAISTQVAIDEFASIRDEMDSAVIDAQLKSLHRKHAIDMLAARNYAGFAALVQKPLVAADGDFLADLLGHARFIYNEANDVEHHKLAAKFFFGLHKAGNADATVDLETLLLVHDSDTSHDVTWLGETPDFVNITS